MRTATPSAVNTSESLKEEERTEGIAEGEEDKLEKGKRLIEATRQVVLDEAMEGSTSSMSTILMEQQKKDMEGKSSKEKIKQKLNEEVYIYIHMCI